MDQTIKTALEKAGWVVKTDYPGAYVRGADLMEREKLDWVADVSEQVRQIEDAAKRKD